MIHEAFNSKLPDKHIELLRQVNQKTIRSVNAVMGWNCEIMNYFTVQQTEKLTKALELLNYKIIIISSLLPTTAMQGGKYARRGTHLCSCCVL